MYTFLFLSICPSFSAEATIFIYADEGTSLFCIECLQRDLNGHNVRTITAEEVITSDWDKEATLFIMPGGRDVPYTEKLNGAGNARIWKYVNEGGHYLGFCAGAYYGSGYVNFDLGTPLEVQGPRELAFFPGTATGPAYGPGTYCYKNRFGARASLIELSDETKMRAYLNGGCYFENADKYPNVTILAHYADIENNPPAIIRCQVGKGTAILSGVHFDISAKDILLEGNAISRKIAAELEPYKKMREKLFRSFIPAKSPDRAAL